MGHVSKKANSLSQISVPQTVAEQADDRRQDSDGSALNQLLERQDIWRGQQWQQQHIAYPTGFSLLDEQLADNGWPQIGVCELLCDGVGQGELTMLLPLLAQLIGSTDAANTAVPQTNAAAVMLVAPPHTPSAQALLQQGLDISRLLWIDTAERKEQLWAIEQALSSGCVPLVLAWLNNLSTTEARRLQLAAEKGGSLCMLYLPTRCAQQSHPVHLRLTIQRRRFAVQHNVNQHTEAADSVAKLTLVPQQTALTRFSNSTLGMTEINIIKRRGGWPSPAFSLPLLPPHVKESLMGVGTDSLEQHGVGKKSIQRVTATEKPLVECGLKLSHSTEISPPSSAATGVFSQQNIAVNKYSISVSALNGVLAKHAAKASSLVSMPQTAASASVLAELSIQFEPMRKLSLKETSLLKPFFNEFDRHSTAAQPNGGVSASMLPLTVADTQTTTEASTACSTSVYPGLLPAMARDLAKVH